MGQIGCLIGQGARQLELSGWESEHRPASEQNAKRLLCEQCRCRTVHVEKKDACYGFRVVLRMCGSGQFGSCFDKDRFFG